MTMQIDNKFELTKDQNNWILTKNTEMFRTSDDKKGRWKKGDKYISQNQTFHPNLKSVLKYCIDDSLKDCETVQELLEAVQRIEEKIDDGMLIDLNQL